MLIRNKGEKMETQKQTRTEPVQVIIVRKDLKMKPGKIAAQVAHASMAVFLDMMRNGKTREEWNKIVENESCNRYAMSLVINKTEEEGLCLHNWLTERFTKIVVSCNSEAELFSIIERAKLLGLPTSLIQDAGFTVFNNIPTYTCGAIGPAKREKINSIVGDLKLY